MIRVGAIKLKDSVDVTDPCYDKDVWCREKYSCIPGKYNCFVEMAKGTVSGIRIVLDRKGIDEVIDKPDAWKEAGCIGVDAGLAGFFDDKPDFSNDKWIKLCNIINFSEKYWIVKFDGRDGFFSTSGYGDGEYSVYAVYDETENTKVIALEIRYL